MSVRSIAHLAKSPTIATASPAVRKWLTNLLRKGERAGGPVVAEEAPARQTKRRAKTIGI